MCNWTVTSIYDAAYKLCKNKFPEIKYQALEQYISDGTRPSSSHHLIVKNNKSNKYKVVTYCDNAAYLIVEDLGWDYKNCLGIYSAVDAGVEKAITPISYCAFNSTLEDIVKGLNLDFKYKKNNTLVFRGFLYGQRLNLEADNDTVKILNHKLPINDYLIELNNQSISLSLNGQAEICNRDIEILSVGSVLLRPKLTRTQFKNPLIEDYHYVSFEYHSDPQEQLNIIIQKYNEIKENFTYLIDIAKNGHEWYLNNGTILANAQIISDTINLEELI